MMIVVGVGDLMQMIGDDHISWVLGGRTVERSDDAVRGLYRT
jgi:hypothetical protein